MPVRKPTESPKPQYYAVIDLHVSLHVLVPDATSLVDAAQKAAAISGEDLWSGKQTVENVFETETYVGSVEGPAKGLK